MAAGLGLLRLAPQQFWAMTPREIAAAIRGLSGLTHPEQPLSRADLTALSSRFPDIG